MNPGSSASFRSQASFFGSIARVVFMSSVITLMWCLIASAPVLAQEQGAELRAATLVSPPFVVKEAGQLTGFSIDVWSEVAARLKMKTTYQEAPDAASLIQMARAKDTDVVVAAFFYTTERDREFDFSLPIMEAGMQVMVRGNASGAESVPGDSTPLKDMLNLLFSRSAAMWLGVVLVIILIPAHVVWFLDRGSEDSISPGRSYFPGIFQALFWSATALVSQVQQVPARWVPRLFGLLWLFAGVVFVALYTAQLTATLTVAQIQGGINGPGDLPGKRVAVVAHSTAADYLRQIKAKPVEVDTADQVSAALLDGRADAAFLNAPVLRYFASHEGKGRVTMVGPEIKKGEMGFAFQLNSPLRRQVNSALIAIREDGTYDRIYAKWFGAE
jgi:polar amino acid transport system substrate-binding protein